MASAVDPDEAILRQEFRARMNLGHNILFLCSTFAYVLLVQTRFQVIRAIVPYSRVWDHCWAITTVTIFFASGVICGMLLPAIRPSFSHSGMQIMSVAVWVTYSLAVDSFVSLFFLIRMRKSLHEGAKKKTRWVIWSLLLIFLCTWLGLGSAAAGALVKQADMKRLAYRLGFSISTVQFSGAVVI